jgi:hypothetical protein
MVIEYLFFVFALNKLFLSFIFIALQRRKVSHKHAARSRRGVLQASGQIRAQEGTKGPTALFFFTRMLCCVWFLSRHKPLSAFSVQDIIALFTITIHRR